jgi:hypothetical protein
MLLPSSLRASAVAALLLVASCGSPSDDIELHGNASLQVYQDYAYYPPELVDEFGRFGLELKPAVGSQLETAVLARIQWDAGEVQSGCDIAIATWHTRSWYTYAWAGDGELMNATPNWWGLAQEAHPEIKDNPIDPNRARLLDVLMTAKPVAAGKALIAWHAIDPPSPADLNGVRAYVIHGCNGNPQFAVTPATIELLPSASKPPSPK